MKRKILSLILVLMLLPIASMFVACGKDDGYNLDNLSADFNEIAEENGNIKIVNNKFVINYADHEKVAIAMSEVDPYTQIESYNFVFDNIMSFAFDYVEVCSDNDLTSNAKIKNQLQDDLYNLKKSFGNVNSALNLFAEIINLSYDIDPLEPHCLTRFESLLVSYEKLFDSAINFNNTLADLYFNHALKEGNPNVFETGFENFDASVVVNNLEGRLKYQISNLSQSYVEMYVSGGDLAERIAKGAVELNLNKYNYKKNVEAVNFVFDEQVAAEKANNNVNKEKFYELSVQAQNIQTILNNDSNKFVTACNDIEYVTVKANLNDAAANDNACVYIVEDNYRLITEYNKVLSQMVNIIK